MNKRILAIEGIAFLLIGVIFLINSFSGLTGNVILENVKANFSALVGIVFVVVGLVVMMAARQVGEGGKEDLEKIAKEGYDKLSYKIQGDIYTTIKNSDDYKKSIKGYRRKLEKTEGKKLDYNHVEKKFREEILPKYSEALKKGYIKRGIENYFERIKEEKLDIGEVNNRIRKLKKVYANEADEALDQNRIYVNRKELLGLAERVLGANRLGKKGKEGTPILNEDDNVITRIPKHRRVGRDLARKIMKAIATGEPQS